jgi:hypothetical protein
MQRMYANIRLPVDVFSDGKFKMIYDQMQISMIPDPKWKDIWNEKVEEMKVEVIERLQESEAEPDPEPPNLNPNPEPEPEKESEKEQEQESDQESEQESDQEPEPEKEQEIKIYANDYPLNRNKKRLNTTFRKNIKRNQITKKNYAEIPI